ncbi:MAG: PQQ-binding-like beta-propeller repeat protein [Acidobacteriota bacterium]
MVKRQMLLVWGLAATVLVLAGTSEGAGWSQFRGADRSGVSNEKGLLKAWPEDGPKVLWRKSIGDGFATVTTHDKAVYVLAGDAENEYALRLDPASGDEVWRTVIGPMFEEAFGNGPRSTPVVDGDRLFALSSTGKLSALAIADGTVKWQIDVTETFGARVPQRGFCPSPIIEGDLLILEIGGSEQRAVVALEKTSGELRWANRESRGGGYSSPIAVTVDGVRQLIFVHSTAREISSISPEGEVLWTHEWPPGAIAMPVFVPPNRVMVSASADVGAVLLEISTEEGQTSVQEVWRNRVMKNHFSSSVHHDGFIYGFDNGTLKCIDAATGEQKWARRGFGKGTLIAADGLLFILGDRGQLALAEATPESYSEAGRWQAFKSKTWSAPALADGRLYLRDQQEIVCLEVAGG